jgi:DsbC/DsbD-like thiol-disulfide interchange protein
MLNGEETAELDNLWLIIGGNVQVNDPAATAITTTTTTTNADAATTSITITTTTTTTTTDVAAIDILLVCENSCFLFYVRLTVHHEFYV